MMLGRFSPSLFPYPNGPPRSHLSSPGERSQDQKRRKYLLLSPSLRFICALAEKERGISPADIFQMQNLMVSIRKMVFLLGGTIHLPFAPLVVGTSQPSLWLATRKTLGIAKRTTTRRKQSILFRRLGPFLSEKKSERRGRPSSFGISLLPSSPR